ncbi:MAG: helix-turn-helix domain-containing protein [Thermoleophilia bacterium]|nr:helix-turn-helix domain-containing protein [Thermoleophilia bacterium]
MDAEKAALQRAFGDAVRERRNDELELTQEQLANSSGLNQNWISHVENGRNALNLWNLHRLASALGLSTPELLARAERHRASRT